jgi:hypothetical protein
MLAAPDAERPYRHKARNVRSLPFENAPFHANDAIMAGNAAGPVAADSVEGSRLGSKTRLPARTRRVGWPHQSLFKFDPCDWSESKRPPTIWIADSVLLKASFCGVLGLECVRSWRRGDAGAERERSLLVAAIWPAQNHRAVPAGLSCQPKDRSTTTPHGMRQTMHRIALDHSACRSSRIDFCCRVSIFPSACRFDAG